LVTKNENGKERYFQKNGDKSFSGIAVNFIDDSVYGKLRKEFTVKSGTPMGPWKIFFKNDVIKTKGNNNENGLIDGKYFEYYENRNFKFEGNIEMD